MEWFLVGCAGRCSHFSLLCLQGCFLMKTVTSTKKARLVRCSSNPQNAKSSPLPVRTESTAVCCCNRLKKPCWWSCSCVALFWDYVSGEQMTTSKHHSSVRHRVCQSTSPACYPLLKSTSNQDALRCAQRWEFLFDMVELSSFVYHLLFLLLVFSL